MGQAITSFRHVRVRICRVAHGRTWLTGWVTHLAPDRARVLLQPAVPLKFGESLAIVCYGDGSLVRFAGRAVAQVSGEVEVTVVGPMAYAPSGEDVRLRVEAMGGALRSGPRGAEIVALDASPESLGGRAGAAFAPGAVLDLSLQTPLGPIQAQVGVLNCRADLGHPGEHRLGLRLLGLSRLDQALWSRMLRERNAD